MKRIITVALAVAVLGLPAAPAAADDLPEACWTSPVSESVECYPNEEALEDAIFEQTGAVVLEEGESARGLLATYLVSRLYEDASYGGDFYNIYSSSSTICSTGSVTGNLASPWNNVVSSFKSYLGCTTRLYEDAGQAGASISGTNVTSLGSMNDKASSYRIN